MSKSYVIYTVCHVNPIVSQICKTMIGKDILHLWVEYQKESQPSDN